MGLPTRLATRTATSGYDRTVHRPASRTQLDKLGKRLAEHGCVPEVDQTIFRQFLDFYQSVLDTVCDELRSIGLAPTSRVKTTGTLIEKLQREKIIQLSRVNDFAGARVVLSDGGLLEQDRCVQSVVRLFGSDDRLPQIIDRRADPRQGYRAVHVIVFPGGTPVEIQVRTELQDSWAQIFEKLADQWGRQLRYGGSIDVDKYAPDAVRVHFEPIVNATVDLLLRLSAGIQIVEDSRRRLLEVEPALKIIDSAGLNESGELVPFRSRAEYLTFRRDVISLLEKHIDDHRRRGRVVRRYLDSSRPDPLKARRALMIASAPIRQTIETDRMATGVLDDLIRTLLGILPNILQGLAEAERLVASE